MSILRESYLYHLWAVLCTVYYDSAVHRCLVRMGAWCNRQIDESRVLRVLCQEGVAARAPHWSCFLGAPSRGPQVSLGHVPVLGAATSTSRPRGAGPEGPTQ